ncbi:endolytic transglycosylase MltG [Corynebacterium uberis]|uniref:endolytic transglycosylase MltG n=1 Tax=Corynebacterium TaxID=1716 RepID=UPI001D0A0647|nr:MULTISPECIES: endolytic transglycosylase MltG [Corynebacterium]MCZ9308564.1 endolytic transglycosylase MltG [Corynebacterium sp. c6VSa_13]UDL74214.1 endolytic transglycosylase MltG [Corynebacterium uberis]UDL74906.1 endolytic transglycosylase MltG [Corynebacterium uberis]UDL77120.1 endolytic transglycosylase MltG [Corynebacterium uberis]UDL79403.1 endolytic transglycosylase MltG [Corynebacterium uberis]
MSQYAARDPKGRRMEPKYVKRRQRGLAVIIATVVLLVGVVIYTGLQVSGAMGSKDYEGTGNGVAALVQVPEGSSVSALGPELVDRGVVKSDSAFQAAAVNHPRAASIQPGFYRLQEHMSAKAAVDALLDPHNQVDLLDVTGGATLMDVTVVAGGTRKGIYTQISELSCDAGNSGHCVTVQQLHDVAAKTPPTELGVPVWAVKAVLERGADPKRLDGLIKPGQYVIDPTMDAKAILKDLITRSTEYYNSTGIEQRAQAIGLSPYELLTAASLVEREAPAGDFDKVARVILNRLAEPMRLEFDSTVNYGLSEQEVATTDGDRAKVTPWNTYAKDGLPATPIAAPSDEAIQAMENPAEGNWLFFVTIDKQGTTVFNDNFDAHQQAVQDAMNSGVLDSNR